MNCVPSSLSSTLISPIPSIGAATTPSVSSATAVRIAASIFSSSFSKFPTFPSASSSAILNAISSRSYPSSSREMISSWSPSIPRSFSQRSAISFAISLSMCGFGSDFFSLASVAIDLSSST